MMLDSLGDDVLSVLIAHLDASSLFQLLTSSKSSLVTVRATGMSAVVHAQLATSAAVCNYKTHFTDGVASEVRQLMISAACLRWQKADHICRLLGRYSRSFPVEMCDSGYNSDGHATVGREFRFYDTAAIVNENVLLAYYGYWSGFNAFDLRTGARIDFDSFLENEETVEFFAGHGNLLACTLDGPRTGVERLVLRRIADWPAAGARPQPAATMDDAELLSFELPDDDADSDDDEEDGSGLAAACLDLSRHYFTAVALSDAVLVAVSQEKCNSWVTDRSVLDLPATVHAHVWRLHGGIPGPRATFPLWDTSKHVILGGHRIVRHVAIVGTLLVVLAEEPEECMNAVNDGWEEGRCIIQVWDLSTQPAQPLIPALYFAPIEMKSYSVVGEQVAGCGCRLHVAAGGSLGRVLLWRCDCWKLNEGDAAFDEDYHGEESVVEVPEVTARLYRKLAAISRATDEVLGPQLAVSSQEMRVKKELERTNVTGVHWDAQKLLLGVGSLVACKAVSPDLRSLEPLWVHKARGSVSGLAACAHRAVVHTSVQDADDQLIALTVGAPPDFVRGHGAVMRGTGAVSYCSESDHESDDSFEFHGEEGEEGEEEEEEGQGEEEEE